MNARKFRTTMPNSELPSQDQLLVTFDNNQKRDETILMVAQSYGRKGIRVLNIFKNEEAKDIYRNLTEDNRLKIRKENEK